MVSDANIQNFEMMSTFEAEDELPAKTKRASNKDTELAIYRYRCDFAKHMSLSYNTLLYANIGA